MDAWGAHIGFSLLIRRMSLRSSGLTLGRPGGPMVQSRKIGVVTMVPFG